MRSNYKKLGEFIKTVEVRNKDLSASTLLGVSMEKCFIPSVANTNNVDLSKYKVVKKNQFACKLMSVGRDQKLPVDLLKNHDEAIVSSAYYVFETRDEELLSSDYLMMWLSRSETDRWVGYVSGGDVRGGISWDLFCELPIVVPSIQKQNQIVSEYKAIVNRIKLNEKVNKKLEATAQAIYKHWFVDFEFPISAEYAAAIGKPGLEGKPYKSSGGEMIFCGELDQEIPKGWCSTYLAKMANISAGGDKPKIYSELINDQCMVPIYSNSTENQGLYGYTNKAKVMEKSITISARGAIIGYTVLRHQPYVPIVRLIVVCPKHEYFLSYLFQAICNFTYDSGASAQGQLTVPEIANYKVLEPDQDTAQLYQNITEKIYNFVELNKAKNKHLKILSEAILARMTLNNREKLAA